MTVLTEKGYLVELNGTLGMQDSKEVYFTGNNCTGDAYIRLYDAIAPGWVIQAGQKTGATVDPNRDLHAYYVPLDAVLAFIRLLITNSLNQSESLCQIIRSLEPVHLRLITWP